MPSASDDGVRRRNPKGKSKELTPKDIYPNQGKKSLSTKEKREESDATILNWFFEILSKVVGLTVMIILSLKFSEYLEILHENELWFSNIKEVEREISFRTEQGLYYSYYKQLVNSKTMRKGIDSLLHDNRTESGRTINILHRFNIYPEITLAFIYRYFDLKEYIPAIFFYTKCVFYLNGFYAACIYLCSWSLSGSWIGGLLSLGLYILNLPDASRVRYTIPLRESFSGPFIFAQLVCLVSYLKNSNKKSRQHLCLLLYGYFTFLFTMSWQFGQFILLLQSIVLYVLNLSNILVFRKLRNIFGVNLVCMLLNFMLHYAQPMILGSLILTFIPVALFSTLVTNSLCKNVCGFWKNATLFTLHFLAVMLLTITLNRSFKIALNIEADDHIFKFLKAKLLFEQSRDFDTLLYLCNGAFNYMDWETIARLWSRLLLPIYLPVEISLLLGLAYSVIYRWLSKDTAPSVFHRRPDLSFWIVLNLIFGLLALSTLRMKMLWTPQICVLASIGVADHSLWITILSKLSSRTKTWLVKVVCCLGSIVLISVIIFKMIPLIDTQLTDLKEFWDPDTVELMNWIKVNTSKTAVFAGSMQLLAGVKLCTQRTITNHPHYEDKWLRDRTKQVYQIYGRRLPKDIHEIMKTVKATHIILEDSICLAVSRNNFCRLPDIVDIYNGHLPDSSLVHNSPQKLSGLVLHNTPRFCDEIRNMNPSYSKYFKKMMTSNTFRVYQVV